MRDEALAGLDALIQDAKPEEPTGLPTTGCRAWSAEEDRQAVTVWTIGPDLMTTWRTRLPGSCRSWRLAATRTISA